MEISKEDLEELKNIYKEDYGETLSDAEALEMGQRLINLFRIIYRPLPSDLNEPEEIAPSKFDSLQYEIALYKKI